MGRGQSQKASGSVASDRLGDQAGVRFTSHASRDGWPDFVFAFHDSDEVGPRMVARVARHTGLKPEDI